MGIRGGFSVALAALGAVLATTLLCSVPALAAPDPGPPPGQRPGAEYIPGSPANYYANMRDAARACDKRAFELYQFSIWDTGRAGPSANEVANWGSLQTWRQKIRKWTFPCKETASAQSGGTGEIYFGMGRSDFVEWYSLGDITRIKLGISVALTKPNTDFIDDGHAKGSAGAICVDASRDFFGSAQRYAGEFSGFRVAGVASLCQGFGTASEPVGGFDGRTSIGTFVTFGGRISAPLNLNGLFLTPYAGAGGAYVHTKIQAFPFEQASGWRWGNYWEVGVSVPVTPQPLWGMGVVQSVDSAAMEVFLAYKRVDVGDKTLDGGARTSTEFGMILGGAKIKY
jgi:hypothetical protein